MIKVLIVDDSAFMRKALNVIFDKDPEISVVGTATNGLDALEKIPKLDPDVVTLDIEMPRMDGLTALQHIMKDMPRPVLMVSSLTSEGAEVTLKAMEYGALDFVAKPHSTISLDIVNQEKELIDKVKAVARRKAFVLRHAAIRASIAGASQSAPGRTLDTRGRTGALAGSGATAGSGVSDSRQVSRPVGKTQLRDIVAIGVSTGGPPAVQKILAALPKDFPAPILIAQHMPASFTGPFARRLDGLCKIEVKEAEDGEKIRDGVAYIAPGGRHMRLVARLANRTLHISDEPKSALYKPSANELIGSVGESQGRRSLGVMLTGMGNDGIEGTKILKAKGGRMLAQSEASCVVYGMPKAVVDAGLADAVLDVDDIAAAIMESMYK
ncbi:MAG: chemotaxis response regulator protein-glutamate methylesterase [Deltaproteobacteria bacterium]|nr:chemotaxis response regulator protein-glutamate methylesterase [Deltaproteobacteria bacterium]